MTRYFLDTTALVDFSLGREPVPSQVLGMMSSRNEVAVSAVQIAEFYSGLSAAERSVWQPFIESLAYWEISQSAARQAGIYRYDFARRGVSLSVADTLIAAVASENAAILITNNAKDFPMADSDFELVVLRPNSPH